MVRSLKHVLISLNQSFFSQMFSIGAPSSLLIGWRPWTPPPNNQTRPERGGHKASVLPEPASQQRPPLWAPALQHGEPRRINEPILVPTPTCGPDHVVPSTLDLPGSRMIDSPGKVTVTDTHMIILEGKVYYDSTTQ